MYCFIHSFIPLYFSDPLCPVEICFINKKIVIKTFLAWSGNPGSVPGWVGGAVGGGGGGQSLVSPYAGMCHPYADMVFGPNCVGNGSTLCLVSMEKDVIFVKQPWVINNFLMFSGTSAVDGDFADLRI